METKQLIFLGMTLVFIPIASWFGIRYRWAERALVAGALLSTSYLIDINLVSMDWYRGDTRGFEFGLTDWMVISLIIVMCRSPRWQNKRPELFPPNSGPMILYLAVAIASVFVAYVPVYAGFGVFKIIRAMLVYWVAYNYLREEKDLKFFVIILMAMVCVEFLFVLEQRAAGIYRAHGTTPHSNTLAIYINMMNMIFLALLLGDAASRKRRLVYAACLGMGTLIVLATFSRGALAMMAIGYPLVIALSFFDRSSRRKVGLVALMVIATIPFIVRFAPAVIERFETAPIGSELSRIQANAGALAMARDHVLGVGLNNYSHVINETHYSTYIPLDSDRGIVHNVYYLHASEMGWIGLIVFLLMIGRFFLMAIRVVLWRRNSLVSWIATGILVAMLTLWLQSWLEWVFRQTYVTVEFYLLAGFLAALGRVDRKSRHARLIRKWFWSWWHLGNAHRHRGRTASVPTPRS
jgi:O-antigen ligase